MADNTQFLKKQDIDINNKPLSYKSISEHSNYYHIDDGVYKIFNCNNNPFFNSLIDELKKCNLLQYQYIRTLSTNNINSFYAFIETIYFVIKDMNIDSYKCPILFSIKKYYSSYGFSDKILNSEFSSFITVSEEKKGYLYL